jgi:hypothetical protein
MKNNTFFLVMATLVICQCSGWLQPSLVCRERKTTSRLLMTKADESSRRALFKQAAIVSSVIFSSVPLPVNAVTRAIGGAEAECRAAGNCLEKLDLDGAIGWAWGGKDRCDATDPKCGPDGRLREEDLVGERVPEVTNKITDVVELKYSVGRGETGVIRLGLYGEDAKDSVAQFIKFVSEGIRTTSDLVFENGMGVESAPVSLTNGGILGQIVPGQRLDFGIPLQSFAYARARGISKAGESFMPQPRPKPIEEPVLRPHTAAGLLSIAGKGIGYGGSGFESEDECFESSFQITSTSVPSMDKKEGRRVIGQVIDQESMSNVARLSSLPTKKGFKGIIPGQNSGPPLLKVSLTDVDVIPVEAPKS